MAATLPSWADIERLSRDDPHVRAALHLHAIGALTREQALILMVRQLAESAKLYREQVVDVLNRNPGHPLSCPRCGAVLSAI